jgi:hypothetical protein
MIRGIVFGATLLTVLPASAADLSQQVADAIASWTTFNIECRGSTSPDSASTMDACEHRDHATVVLHRLGWCRGKQGELGYQMKWHSCTATSYR